METSPRSTVIEPEILPREDMRPKIHAGPVTFDARSTLQSPFFWIVVGGIGTAALIYLVHKFSKK
jgi:hypothetical protein